MVKIIGQLSRFGAMIMLLVVGIVAAACGEDETQVTRVPDSDQDPSVPAILVVPAPIETIEIEKLAAKPPNATMIVVSGLPSGCHTFNTYSLTQEGDVFNLEVTNLEQGLACSATYTTVTTSIPLDPPVFSNIESCKTYDVVVNGETRSVESSCPAIANGPNGTNEVTPTPGPIQEWTIQEIQVDGSTVVVPLQVFAGIDIQATLDGRDPDEINDPIPTLEFVFHNVTPGTHTIEVKDVVGFNTTLEVVVPSPASTGTPAPDLEWLTRLIDRLEKEPVANPPLSITQYEYQNQTVYFVPQRCCDIFSDLYDAEGNIIAHPDGGITGRGDGRVTDFFESRINGTPIWEDRRIPDLGQVQSLAPIESLEISIMESFPLQYSLSVVSGLPNSCISFGGYTTHQQDNFIRVEVVNWGPVDRETACDQVYSTVMTNIPLGTGFETGTTYTVEVNDLMETFVAR